MDQKYLCSDCQLEEVEQTNGQNHGYTKFEHIWENNQQAEFDWHYDTEYHSDTPKVPNTTGAPLSQLIGATTLLNGRQSAVVKSDTCEVVGPTNKLLKFHVVFANNPV